MLSCLKVNRYLALQEQAYAISKLDLDAVESTVLSSIRKGGESSEHNSHKRHKGVTIHVAVSPSGLTLSIVVGPGKVLGYFHLFLSKCHRIFLRTGPELASYTYHIIQSSNSD